VQFTCSNLNELVNDKLLADKLSTHQGLLFKVIDINNNDKERVSMTNYEVKNTWLDEKEDHVPMVTYIFLKHTPHHQPSPCQEGYSVI
jgi:hypothetical protein